MSWRWTDRRALCLLQDESVAAHGAAPGLRDEGLPESALARPLNLSACGEPGVFELTAAHGVGLAKNHAFVDGNKRAAFLAGDCFWCSTAIDGAPHNTSTLTMFALAAGSLGEAAFAARLRSRSLPRRLL